MTEPQKTITTRAPQPVGWAELAKPNVYRATPVGTQVGWNECSWHALAGPCHPDVVRPVAALSGTTFAFAPAAVVDGLCLGRFGSASV